MWAGAVSAYADHWARDWRIASRHVYKCVLYWKRGRCDYSCLLVCALSTSFSRCSAGVHSAASRTRLSPPAPHTSVASSLLARRVLCVCVPCPVGAGRFCAYEHGRVRCPLSNSYGARRGGGRLSSDGYTEDPPTRQPGGRLICAGCGWLESCMRDTFQITI